MHKLTFEIFENFKILNHTMVYYLVERKIIFNVYIGFKIIIKTKHNGSLKCNTSFQYIRLTLLC